MIGAVLGGAGDKDVDKLMEIGSKIGIAFQIRDDILDIEGNFEVFGKPIGSDWENGKLTYVSLYGMDKAKADVDKYSREALEGLKSFPLRNEFLEWLVENLINRNLLVEIQIFEFHIKSRNKKIGHNSKQNSRYQEIPKCGNCKCNCT